MQSKKVVYVAALLGVLAVAPAFADGGAGGFFAGQYAGNFAGLESDTSVGFIQGGLGYGVNSEGVKIGGWGLSLWGSEDRVDFRGAFGGTVHGFERDLGAIHLGVTGLIGIGYSAFPNVSAGTALFGEANLEVGWAVTNWFMIQGYGGAQLIANIFSGPLFSQRNFSWTYGVRFLWGSFR